MPVRVILVLLLVLASGTSSTTLAHEGLPSEYNFRDHVRPIFLKHCAGCHRPGGVAPMSLLSYSDAVPWANSVKMQVLDDQMPPWLPTEGIGAFQHTRSLSAEEIDVLIDWVIGQTPEGEPLTPAELDIDSPPEWTMGEPDLVLAPDADIVIGEDEYEATRCLVLPTKTTEARIASELEVNPGLESLVRRATIYLGESCESARPLATWLPGQGSVSLGRERGHELPAGASLAMELLYVKGWEDEGKRLSDRSELGIRFSESARAVSALRLADAGHTFTGEVELLAIYPEPALDEPWRLEVVHPGGKVEPILAIERFSSQWGEKYYLSEPLALLPGAELRVSQPAGWVEFIQKSAPGAE